MKKNVFKYICFAFVFAVILCLSVCANEYEVISVGLYFDSAAMGQYEIYTPGGFCLGSVENGEFILKDSFISENITVHCDGNIISVMADGVLVDAFSSEVAIKPLFEENTFTLEGKSYKGFVEFKKQSFGKMSAVNFVNTEDYVKGVLPGEFIPSWEDEALKAGAVAIRTYVLKNLGKHDGFDICSTVHCQVYSGTKNSTPKTDKAVDETKDMVLCYNGKLALTVYCAGSVGATESAYNVWGSDMTVYPYLSGSDISFVPNKYHERLFWKKLVTPLELGQLVGLSDVVKIDCEYAPSGYVSDITLYSSDGQQKSATRSSGARSLLTGVAESGKFTVHNTYALSYDGQAQNVQVITSGGTLEANSSELCVVTADGQKNIDGLEKVFFFDGSGRGHGIGLSQYTCQGLACMGYSFGDILYLFYPGTSLCFLQDMVDNIP